MARGEIVTDTNKVKIAPLALAEAGSTAVTLGSLWAMERGESLFEPLQHYLTRTIVYPSMFKGKQVPDASEKDPTYQRAYERSSLIVKGVGMNVVGIAAHVPLQMALEGKTDAKSFGIMAAGKTLGVGVSLGSILTLNKIVPEFLPSLEKAMMPVIAPLLPKDKEDRKAAEEVAKLLILDIPATAISLVVNYTVAHKMRG